MSKVATATGLFLASASPVFGQYTLHELDVPPGTVDSIVTAIDDDGVIVGSVRVAADRVATRWESFDAPAEFLGTLDGGRESEAISIASGLIVGVSDRACGETGSFLWTSSDGMVPIGPTECTPVRAVGVNDSGEALLQIGLLQSPIVWPLASGAPRPLDTWDELATVLRIEDDGAVLGSSMHHPDGAGAGRGIVWPESGEARLLGRLDATVAGVDAAFDRGPMGMIVGFAQSGPDMRATVWNASGEATDVGIDLGPSIPSQLNAVNGDALAVGQSSLGAIVWDETAGVRLLADLVDDTGDGWELITAQGLNDDGVIIGIGVNPAGRLRGFALSAGGTPCQADLDGDGMLTIFDFLAFQNLFDSGDPLADFDGDGSLTIFDFLAFQNAFDAGC